MDSELFQTLLRWVIIPVAVGVVLVFVAQQKSSTPKQGKSSAQKPKTNPAPVPVVQPQTVPPPLPAGTTPAAGAAPATPAAPTAPAATPPNPPTVTTNAPAPQNGRPWWKSLLMGLGFAFAAYAADWAISWFITLETGIPIVWSDYRFSILIIPAMIAWFAMPLCNDWWGKRFNDVGWICFTVQNLFKVLMVGFKLRKWNGVNAEGNPIGDTILLANFTNSSDYWEAFTHSRGFPICIALIVIAILMVIMWRNAGWKTMFSKYPKFLWNLLVVVAILGALFWIVTHAIGWANDIRARSDGHQLAAAENSNRKLEQLKTDEFYVTNLEWTVIQIPGQGSYLGHLSFDVPKVGRFLWMDGSGQAVVQEPGQIPVLTVTARGQLRVKALTPGRYRRTVTYYKSVPL